MHLVPIAALPCVLALATACAGPMMGPELGGAVLAVGAEHMPMPPLAPVERGAYRTRDLRTGEQLSLPTYESAPLTTGVGGETAP